MRLVILIILMLASPAFAAHSLKLFSTAKAAQQRCPHDSVVWLNTHSGIWHYRGSRWFGNIEYGAYACEKEAHADGDRASKAG